MEKTTAILIFFGISHSETLNHHVPVWIPSVLKWKIENQRTLYGIKFTYFNESPSGNGSKVLTSLIVHSFAYLANSFTFALAHLNGIQLDSSNYENIHRCMHEIKVQLVV